MIEMFAGRRWISCREAAEYLGLSAKHVSELCLRGEIPSAKIGGSRRIDLRALEGNLEKRISGSRGQEMRRE